MAFLLGALSVIVAFGLVIFVHEFGLFIVAKKTGVKVERFSFGLGPELVGFQWGETRYCLAWIPLGGEVRMAGEADPANPRHVVTVRGENVRLPLKEFELLEVLLRNAGRVLTRMQLIDRVWGADYVGDTKTLDVHIKRLRAKIEEDSSSPKYIVTVRGLGYKFEPVVAAVD